MAARRAMSPINCTKSSIGSNYIIRQIIESSNHILPDKEKRDERIAHPASLSVRGSRSKVLDHRVSFGSHEIAGSREAEP